MCTGNANSSAQDVAKTADTVGGWRAAPAVGAWCETLETLRASPDASGDVDPGAEHLVQALRSVGLHVSIKSLPGNNQSPYRVLVTGATEKELDAIQIPTSIFGESLTFDVVDFAVYTGDTNKYLNRSLVTDFAMKSARLNKAIAINKKDQAAGYNVFKSNGHSSFSYAIDELNSLYSKTHGTSDSTGSLKKYDVAFMAKKTNN